MDVVGGADPFLIIRDSRGKLLYRSEIVYKTLKPSWDPFTLNVADLGGLDAKFKIEVRDFDAGRESELVGFAQCTLRELSFGPSITALYQGSSTSGKSRGGLTVTSVEHSNLCACLSPRSRSWSISRCSCMLCPW